MMDEKNKRTRQEIFTRVAKAGRRTYFFDVKQTRKGDLYLTITESKKFYDKKKDSHHFKKHTIFLYREAFDDFYDALDGVVNFINDNIDESLEKGGLEPAEPEQEQESSAEEQTSATKEEPVQQDESVNEDPSPENHPDEAFTDVSFDDLNESDKESDNSEEEEK
ncbi:MAG: DUF3276 family protein [Bacteroidota bacterium]